ncbi:MAG: serine/threonine protein kinase [Candidatus Hydrogenedentes bacterium]|nr:serine/threonine protein kinase [Candidatus Hydrogenedentota bacterium]
MPDVKCPRCALPEVSDNGLCPECGAQLSNGLIVIASETPIDPEEGDIFQIGDLINNRYEVQSLIGRGGMGSVYKVSDKVLNEELALKVLLPYFASDKNIVERFINEVRITRRITHPNIVRVHDIGLAGDNLFISMEYVAGESLSAILKRMGDNAHLGVRQSVHIMTQVSIALKYAHHFTIHRDIKPDNIMVTAKNHIKLMDFGISKLRDERFDTNDHEIVGTPQYMAPEQIHQAPNVDGRADIYSLGVVLHELLTGTIPTGLMQPFPNAPVDLSPDLEAIVLKCLESDREKRYADANELLTALRSLAMLSESDQSAMFTPHKSSASGILTPAPFTSSMTDILESFMKDENIRFFDSDSDSVGSESDSNLRSSGDQQSRISSDSSIDDHPFSKSKTVAKSAGYPGAKKKYQPTFFEAYGKVIGIVCAILLVLGVAFFGKSHFSADDDEPIAAEKPSTEVIKNKVLAKVASKNSVMDAFVAIQESYRRDPSPENREAIEIVREIAIDSLLADLYAVPFNMKKMNAASNGVVRLIQIDNDIRIASLREEINREVALFKFVLTAVDSEQNTAVFRLNNPYYPSDTETVQEGDLLQKRFLITGISAKAVYLEDTNPRCKGRTLLARVMEPITAR